MKSKRNTKASTEATTHVGVRVPVSLAERFRRAVAAQERTPSQAIRLHMQQTVAEAERSEVAA